MTNPRSSPTLRSDRVENLQRGGGKRQKLKAADLAECTKTSGSESRSARCFPRTMTRGWKILTYKAVKSFYFQTRPRKEKQMKNDLFIFSFEQ